MYKIEIEKVSIKWSEDYRKQITKNLESIELTVSSEDESEEYIKKLNKELFTDYLNNFKVVSDSLKELPIELYEDNSFYTYTLKVSSIISILENIINSEKYHNSDRFPFYKKVKVTRLVTLDV